MDLRDRRGDGAEWIWNAAAEQFPGHRGTLDVFHAGEHLAAAALFGEGTAATPIWYHGARKALLEDGWYGIQEHIGQTLCGAAEFGVRSGVPAESYAVSGRRPTFRPVRRWAVSPRRRGAAP